MDKMGTLKAFEDLLDESAIPMVDYTVRMDKANGNLTLQIRKDTAKKDSITHMYLLSEIINSITQDWSVQIIDNCIVLVIE